MAALRLPADLARAARDALTAEPEHSSVRSFLRLVRENRSCSPARPRGLLRWGYDRSISVRGGRYVTILLTGFAGAGQVRRMTRALAELLIGYAEVTADPTKGEIYADGHELLVIGGGGSRFAGDPWDYGRDPFSPAGAGVAAELAVLPPTAAGGTPAPKLPAPAPAVPAPAAPARPAVRPPGAPPFVARRS